VALPPMLLADVGVAGRPEHRPLTDGAVAAFARR
jgi:hypothetical protein